MFDKLKVPILGLVDNMSFFETENGKNYNIFGQGGVEKLATDYKKDFLGKIPINIDLREAADNGKPLVEKDSNHKISKIFIEIAKKIISKMWFFELKNNLKFILALNQLPQQWLIQLQIF